MKKIFLILLFSACLFAEYPFGVYYGKALSPIFLQKFDVLVVDPDSYQDATIFTNKPYAYISIGEVESHRDYYEYVKSKGVLGKANPNWTNSYYVSLLGKEWKAFVLDELIPKILERGYSALFLDTVDSLIASGQKKEDIIVFINDIKLKYPNVKIMMNRGFEVANFVNVDSILLESTITTVENNKTFMRSAPYIPDIKNKRLYSLDYWDINDIKGMEAVYKKALTLGYTPFVTDFSLMKIPTFLLNDSGKFVQIK